MGRLTLNMLLSFAQFEREITGERIRDKFAASKKKGMWMGGFPPLGSDIAERKLVVNVREAEAVRHIFGQYLELGSVRALNQALDAEGLVGKVHETQSGRRWGGKLLARGVFYRLLQNPIYRGEIAHKNDTYPGQHEAIVGADLWRAVQVRLANKRIKRMSGANLKSHSLLAGVLFDADGHRMTPTHAVKKGTRYRYYVSRSLITGDDKAYANSQRIPANEIEGLVMTRIRAFLRDEAQMLDALSTSIQDPALLRQFLTKAQELGEACSAKITEDKESSIRSVINRIDVHVDKVDLHLSPARLCNVLEEKVSRSDSPVEPESSAAVFRQRPAPRQERFSPGRCHCQKRNT